MWFANSLRVYMYRDANVVCTGWNWNDNIEYKDVYMIESIPSTSGLSHSLSMKNCEGSKVWRSRFLFPTPFFSACGG